jgi:hypothetical protein
MLPQPPQISPTEAKTAAESRLTLARRRNVCYVCFVVWCVCVRECFAVLLIVIEQESSGVAAGTRRASRRRCFVVSCRLPFARYHAIACLGFPPLLRCPVNDVGIGWVGCCAALCRVVVCYLISFAALRMVRYDNRMCK